MSKVCLLKFRLLLSGATLYLQSLPMNFLKTENRATLNQRQPLKSQNEQELVKTGAGMTFPIPSKNQITSCTII